MARRVTYERLLGVIQASLRQAKEVRERLAVKGNKATLRLVREIDRFVPLVQQVVSQAERRVLQGEAVSAGEKLVSLFGHPPSLFAADRGVYSAGNELAAQGAGVRRAVLPKPGGKSIQRKRHERQDWFRRGLRFPAPYFAPKTS